MHVEPQVTGPRGNLAALYDHLAEAGECTVEEANRFRQEAVRLRREELDYLARDVRLAPEAASLQYRYGMLLYLHRRWKDAEAALRKANELEPNNPQFLMGVVLFYKEQGPLEKALPLAEKLVALRPEEDMYRKILDELRGEAGAGFGSP
jgi:tetratricopeptide (TPR) repeat protein